MAKREASTEGPTTFAPAPTSPGPEAAVARTIDVANKIDTNSREVVQWGNGAAKGFEVVDTSAPTETTKHGDGGEAEETTPTERPAKEKPTEKPTEEEKTEETPAQTTGKLKPERRREIVANLEDERKRVDIENQVVQARAEAAKAGEKWTGFEQLSLGEKLKIIAKQHNMSTEDLKDKFLIDAEELKAPPESARREETTDPKVQELLTWKAQREAREAREQVEQASEAIAESLKDSADSIPLVDAYNAYDKVLVRAHDFWLAEKKQGTVQDYVQDAAEMIEEEMRANPQYARAAARFYREETQQEAPQATKPARTTARPAMGRRTAAKPPTPAWKPTTLDPLDRDEQIKKRFGWT